LRITLAIVLLSLLMCFPRTAQARSGSSNLLVMVRSDGSSQATAAAIVSLSRLACIPHVAILEGLKTEVISAELELSKSDLVAAKSKVTNKRLKPDVTLTFKAIDGCPADAFGGELEISAEGLKEVMPVVTGHDFALPHQVRLELLTRLDGMVPGDKALAWERTCLGPIPELSLLTSGECTKAFECVCAGKGPGLFDEVGCISELAAGLVSKKRGMAKSSEAYIDFSDKELKVLERINERDKSVYKDSSLKPVLEKMGKKTLEFQAELKKAIQSVKDSTLVILNSKLGFPLDLMRVKARVMNGFSAQTVTMIGFRFKKGDSQPYAKLNIPFTASKPREERDVYGQLRTFEKILRSFQLYGFDDQDNEQFRYQLMVSKDRQEGGSIDTAITMKRLKSVRSYGFGEVNQKDKQVR
jgi:hypothetical protein